LSEFINIWIRKPGLSETAVTYYVPIFMRVISLKSSD